MAATTKLSGVCLATGVSPLSVVTSVSLPDAGSAFTRLLSTVGAEYEVISGLQMTLRAVGRIEASPAEVFFLCHWLQMPRIGAARNPAKVV
jgi:hypothetical protein